MDETIYDSALRRRDEAVFAYGPRDQMTISLEVQIQCVEREIRLRKSVFRRRVVGGTMSQASADRELATMEAVLETLTKLRPTLFKQ